MAERTAGIARSPSIISDACPFAEGSCVGAAIRPPRSTTTSLARGSNAERDERIRPTVERSPTSQVARELREIPQRLVEAAERVREWVRDHGRGGGPERDYGGGGHER